MKLGKSSQSTPTSLRVAKLCMFFMLYITGKLFSPQTTLIDFYKVSLFGTKLGYLLRALFIAQILNFPNYSKLVYFFGSAVKFLLAFYQITLTCLFGALRIPYTF
jgi:hypothetical protein